MKFLKFFLLLWVIFALLDSDPDQDSKYGSGSTDQIESGSATLHENVSRVSICGGRGMHRTYTVKKVSDFTIPSRDVHNQTLPGGE